ncbi:MAG: class I SAM-dependent methyltransferase [Proteobacteria bacterium]|nr:class I SAM-dependent methyltransferase [Pseudomonadota bacterium]
MAVDFNALAKDWDLDPEKVERAKVTAELIEKRATVTKETTALEYGCGTGQVSFFLQPKLKEITLADDSEGMLEVLRDKIKSAGVDNMKTLMADFSKDALPNEKYDLIYISMTLHHIIDADSVLRAFHSLLKPGGSLCIADFDKDDGSFHANHEGFEGHHGFERKELSDMLSKTGFKDAKFEECFKIMKEVDGKEREFPVFFVHCTRA